MMSPRARGAIYQLPDYHIFDGVVILGEVLRPDVTREIIRRAAEADVPVIDVNDVYDGCYQIGYNDTIGMKEMVLHLIREHDCRDIYFMSGFKGNKESEEREAAYRSALEEEGIEFQRDHVGYGQFYMQAADVIQEYLGIGIRCRMRLCVPTIPWRCLSLSISMTMNIRCRRM